jgi:hypothetical protein
VSAPSIKRRNAWAFVVLAAAARASSLRDCSALSLTVILLSAIQ